MGDADGQEGVGSLTTGIRRCSGGRTLPLEVRMETCLFGEDIHSTCEQVCLHLLGVNLQLIFCFEGVSLATAAASGQKGAIKGNPIFCLCSESFSRSGSELAVV